VGHEGKACAVTGSIHTPSMSEPLPVTAEQIAEAAITAAEAGCHRPSACRDPETGKPDQSVAAYEPFLKVIAQRTKRGHQHHDRRRAWDDAGTTVGAGTGVFARARLAQHGFDEFAEPLQDATNRDQVLLARQIVEGWV
jgi:hypothetical protein